MTRLECIESLNALHRAMSEDWPDGAFADADPATLGKLASAEAEVDRLAKLPLGPSRDDWEDALQALALALTRIRREAVQRAAA